MRTVSARDDNSHQARTSTAPAPAKGPSLSRDATPRLSRPTTGGSVAPRISIAERASRTTRRVSVVNQKTAQTSVGFGRGGASTRTGSNNQAPEPRRSIDKRANKPTSASAASTSTPTTRHISTVKFTPASETAPWSATRSDREEVDGRNNNNSNSNVNNGAITTTQPKQLWHGPKRPSARIDQRKTSDPFAKPARGTSTFAFVYAQGGIPCRLNHGGVTCRLQWDTEPESMQSYDPLLVHCVQGLTETKHPFAFVARTATRELLEASGGGEKALPLLRRLIPALRATLMSTDDDVFIAGLGAIQALSTAVGPAMDAQLGSLLIQINKKTFHPTLRNHVHTTLLVLASNGGNKAASIIKSKVPTFTGSSGLVGRG